MISEWKELLEMERRQKNTFFSIHPQSPIPPEKREGFEGLHYYPPDSDYRFELTLYEHPEKKKVEMVYTRGEEQEFTKWGEFRFKIDSQQRVLQAYKSDPAKEGLFVPFKDATNGKETYGAGRYLDLDPQRDLTTEGKWILDFNRAYNPWCAYSESYTCPFVPPENWLKVPICAGEKQFETTKEGANDV